MNPYTDLAHGIILQAVKDYRGALKTLGKNSKYAPALIMKSECEQFFRSDWFTMLSGIDGERLLRSLCEEAA